MPPAHVRPIPAAFGLRSRPRALRGACLAAGARGVGASELTGGWRTLVPPAAARLPTDTFAALPRPVGCPQRTPPKSRCFNPGRSCAHTGHTASRCCGRWLRQETSGQWSTARPPPLQEAHRSAGEPLRGSWRMCVAQKAAGPGSCLPPWPFPHPPPLSVHTAGRKHGGGWLLEAPVARACLRRCTL